MTSQQQTTPTENKTGRGRPKGSANKAGKGAMMWIPAELKDTVNLLIQAQKQKQAKQ
jgi:hypothetical protein